MYTLKSIVKRGTSVTAVAVLALSALAPAAPAFAANALNPLTERSLLLSSSAPGFQDTDGSGNSEAGGGNAIGENYAPAGSGPNGKKTGQTFTFTTSSDGTIKGFSLQYCTTAAGVCRAPGDNTGDADPDNDGVGEGTDISTRQANEDSAPGANDGGHSNETSDLDFVSDFTQGAAEGNFEVYVGGVATTEEWAFTKANLEDPEYVGSGSQAGLLTGKNNYVTLTSTTGQSIPAGTEVQIVFRASESIYITNPGSGSFFVKINTYNSDTNLLGNHNEEDEGLHTVVDGGVTVANVMTDSIHITTKVLETMAFSVGTRNRDTLTLNCAGYPSEATIEAGCESDDVSNSASHGTCSPIQQLNDNRLNLGNPDAEYSLETSKGWSVNSYWRLSSNSSGGATVYYSGDTLRNTVGDHIADMENEVESQPGTEQFGLGFVPVDAPSAEFTAQQPGREVDSFPFRTLADQTTGKFDLVNLPAQSASTAYDEAEGTLDDGNGNSGDAKFKFLESSLTVPEVIAQQNDQVISCATAKMRYVGNIAADTPAGVYTTKINYLAAPQY